MSEGTEAARLLAEETLGHRVTVCTCGSDSDASAHLECGQCGRVAWQVGDKVWGAATAVGCPFTEAGRAYNEQNGVQW